jgi:hypothetical protein
MKNFSAKVEEKPGEGFVFTFTRFEPPAEKVIKTIHGNIDSLKRFVDNLTEQQLKDMFPKR